MTKRRIDKAMRDAGALERGRWVVEEALRFADRLMARTDLPMDVAELAARVLTGEATVEHNRRCTSAPPTRGRT